MFSKGEFRRFLAQLRGIEQHMAKCYEEILRDLEDEKLRKTFSGLLKSEQRHDSILEELEAL